MVVLVAIGAIGLAACYSPSLRDCSVVCNDSRDCARGQVCSSAGLCAAPEAADRCADPFSDAGATDAGPHVTLHVHVDGPGEIDFDVNQCRADCMYSVAVHTQVTLIAVDINDHEFDHWTMGPCANQSTRTCAFVLTAATNANAKWH
jgi:hypothetical protein